MGSKYSRGKPRGSIFAWQSAHACTDRCFSRSCFTVWAPRTSGSPSRPDPVPVPPLPRPKWTCLFPDSDRLCAARPKTPPAYDRAPPVDSHHTGRETEPRVRVPGVVCPLGKSVEMPHVKPSFNFLEARTRNGHSDFVAAFPDFSNEILEPSFRISIASLSR